MRPRGTGTGEAGGEAEKRPRRGATLGTQLTHGPGPAQASLLLSVSGLALGLSNLTEQLRLQESRPARLQTPVKPPQSNLGAALPPPGSEGSVLIREGKKEVGTGTA